MDNPKKLATLGTQEDDKQNKNTIQNVLDTKQTQIAYTMQTTGGKDERKIVFMRKSQRTSQHGIKNVKTHNRTTQKTI